MSSKARKKNTEEKPSENESPFDRELRIQKKINETLEKINAQRKSLGDKMSEINNQMLEDGKQKHSLLTEYIAKYDGCDVDSDFAELLSIYKERQNSVNDEYLAALSKCRDKNLPETKVLCELEDKRKSLENKFDSICAESDEWSDVFNLKAREVWNNPECEKTYNQLFALKNDEVYKQRTEKAKQWEKYSKGHVVACTKIASRLYHIGRNENNIAIWDMDYNGQIITIDDVMFFQVSEKTTTNTYTSSTGSPSKLGTAFNEMIWGTAAATASAMQKNQQSTSTYTNTNKTATIYFKYELGIEPLEASNHDVDKLIAMMLKN